jgi:hypothetical protein
LIQIPNGSIHFHVCGILEDDCKGAIKASACLKKISGTPEALTLDKITYNGEAVRISYGKSAVLILYCGRDSSTPQYIGQVRN